ncbi:PanM family protein [Moritella marina ATCC 15381]|uniref:PanM family protein n=1 Tax=Moritella marina ATCC 15381 TaxID=1202962 RepID=A0A5J6WQM8_MORMI|nr:acetyl-CoA sensor PanZ family protein [Moritella marina]QFI39694.1 PanM family protein [Moritella marina ATCC 15381]
MRLSAFTVTESTPQLLIDIIKLYRPFQHDEADIKNSFETLLQNDSQTLFVAKFNDRHIGGLIMQNDATTLFLSCIAVRDITQQRGVGKYLVQRAIENAKSLGLESVTVVKTVQITAELSAFLIHLGFNEQASEFSFNC